MAWSNVNLKGKKLVQASLSVGKHSISRCGKNIEDIFSLGWGWVPEQRFDRNGVLQLHPGPGSDVTSPLQHFVDVEVLLQGGGVQPTGHRSVHTDGVNQNWPISWLHVDDDDDVSVGAAAVRWSSASGIWRRDRDQQLGSRRIWPRCPGCCCFFLVQRESLKVFWCYVISSETSLTTVYSPISLNA